ncbi:MAG TPA: glutaredoxin [Vicinamibacterales bacterium]|nr:glutaredoxin [Vicinamibacterales bacterium]
MEEVVTAVELFGAAGCPYTAELREHLQWTGVEFAEYDVDADGAARARLAGLMGGSASVPVLVENGQVTQIGWRGRSCVVGR